MAGRSVLLGRLVLAVALCPGSALAQRGQRPDSLFRASDVCIACHNDLTAASGEDISIGYDWRSSMMANSARDPYWQAGVRREIVDHPTAAAAIEDECAKCHMPMARYTAHVGGERGAVFANLPVGGSQAPLALMAADGVSCSVCHQIEAANLGSPASFTGGFVVDHARPLNERVEHGPYEVDAGRRRVMQSASGFAPARSPHIQSSALCATCHTLYTKALNEAGEEVGQLAEQMPFREWQHSAYRDERSCQDCHMPVVAGKAPITGVLAQPRDSVSRHVFRGGNFFMLRMLNRYRNELGVQALPQELEAAASRTVEHLRTNTASVAVDDVAVESGRLTFSVRIENKAGHKLPTAYPSRRAWLHVTVRDASGHVVFESGAPRNDGAISGNDNDDDPGAFEPHYTEIEHPDQVQIYESIMEHYDGGPTTGLLNGVGYLKDNRILPLGFDKASAEWDIAVRGNAVDDPDFAGGSDRVRYAVSLSGAPRPYTISVELLYQPIAYRWAHNLAEYDAFETQRFVRYYESMSTATYQPLATTTAVTR